MGIMMKIPVTGVCARLRDPCTLTACIKKIACLLQVCLPCGQCWACEVERERLCFSRREDCIPEV